jgi:manganese/zinc/iron transport system permease protein
LSPTPIAHATLPGVGLPSSSWWRLAETGETLLGLLIGSAITAAVGLLAIQWIVARTRLTEDAAIGAVLGVFFGFGIVLLTVIQSMSSGRQAGLEGFLLGSTAGMLRQDAIVILAGGARWRLLVWVPAAADDAGGLRPEYATAAGTTCRAST